MVQSYKVKAAGSDFRKHFFDKTVKLLNSSTCIKSAAVDFENIKAKIWEISTNESVIIDRFENIVTKGEIACYEHFLLFPQYFQILSSADVLKCVCLGKGVLGSTI